MLSCQVDRDNPVTVLRLVGELRLGTVGQVRATLVKCMAECPIAVVVDLAGLSVSDPVALTVFGAVAHRAADWPPVPLVLGAPPPRLQTTIERVCRPWRIPVCASIADALALASRARPPNQRVRRTFRPGSDAPAAARSMVADACAEWRLAGLTMPAELIMTELVSNAVEHARTDLEARATLRRELLHLTVSDGSPNPPRIGATSPPMEVTAGRGLLLVAKFATAWGYLPIEGGKVVWATLRIPGTEG